MNGLARLRFLVATMIGAYLVINALMFALDPLIGRLNPFLSTAVLVPPMVLAMVYMVIPLAKRS